MSRMCCVGFEGSVSRFYLHKGNVLHFALEKRGPLVLALGSSVLQVLGFSGYPVLWLSGMDVCARAVCVCVLFCGLCVWAVLGLLVCLTWVGCVWAGCERLCGVGWVWRVCPASPPFCPGRREQAQRHKAQTEMSQAKIKTAAQEIFEIYAHIHVYA